MRRLLGKLLFASAGQEMLAGGWWLETDNYYLNFPPPKELIIKRREVYEKVSIPRTFFIASGSRIQTFYQFCEQLCCSKLRTQIKCQHNHYNV